MSNIVYMLSIKQALIASRLIANTINKSKGWSEEHESLRSSLLHALIMQHKYEKKNENPNNMEF